MAAVITEDAVELAVPEVRALVVAALKRSRYFPIAKNLDNGAETFQRRGERDLLVLTESAGLLTVGRRKRRGYQTPRPYEVCRVQPYKDRRAAAKGQVVSLAAEGGELVVLLSETDAEKVRELGRAFQPEDPRPVRWRAAGE